MISDVTSQRADVNNCEFVRAISKKRRKKKRSKGRVRLLSGGLTDDPESLYCRKTTGDGDASLSEQEQSFADLFSRKYHNITQKGERRVKTCKIFTSAEQSHTEESKK